MDILDNFGVNMGQVKKLGKGRERELGGDGNRTKAINGSFTKYYLCNLCWHLYRFFLASIFLKMEIQWYDIVDNRHKWTLTSDVFFVLSMF